MSEHFDVVVVGGGPAGSVAAASCARAGLRVAILERAAFPRERPGETLHPGAEVVLRTLGVWERVEHAVRVRHLGTRVCWGGSEGVVHFGADAQGSWLGMQIERAELDTILLDAAAEVGVTLLQPALARDPILTDGAVTGLRTSSGAVYSKFVIDAGGGGQWLARRLGVGVSHATSRLIARYGYVTRSGGPLVDLPSMRASSSGWSWVAPIGGDRYAWCSLGIEGDGPRPPELDGLHLGRERTSDVTWRIAGRLAGPGFLLAGDAAFVVDPSSSHGVLKAIVSGALCARVVAEAHRHPQHAADAFGAYDSTMRRWFVHDVEALDALYATAFPGWRGRSLAGDR